MVAGRNRERAVMDIGILGDGMFTARTTADGSPTSFAMDGMDLVITRGDTEQRINSASMLGAVAVCGVDGKVMAYGSCDIGDLEGMADRMEGEKRTPGGPMKRLANSGIMLALPLDAMPPEVRNRFLEESVDAETLDMTRLDDVSLEKAREAANRHAHGDHAHEQGEECQECDELLDELRGDIDVIVEAHGHACIGTADMGTPRAYTVGLDQGGWPELVITGLAGQGVTVLNDLVLALRGKDRRPHDGIEVAGAVSVPLRLRTVNGGEAWLKVAADRVNRLRQGARPQVLQVVWPDADGNWPEECDYDDVNLPQPLL